MEKIIKYVKVEERIWGPEDTYLSIALQVTVYEHEGYKIGDVVKITIEKEEA